MRGIGNGIQESRNTGTIGFSANLGRPHNQSFEPIAYAPAQLHVEHMMNDTVIYGHRHFGFWFKPILLVTPNGFEFKGKHYQWNDIVRINPHDSIVYLFLFNKTPRSSIVLSDGKRIWINARALEKQGVKPHISFFSCISDAYEELMALIRNKISIFQPEHTADRYRSG